MWLLETLLPPLSHAAPQPLCAPASPPGGDTRAVGIHVLLYCLLSPTRAPSLATANCCLHPAYAIPFPAFPDSQEIVTDALDSGGFGTTWKAFRGEGWKELERTGDCWSDKCFSSLEIQELGLQRGIYSSLTDEMIYSCTNCPD